MRNTQATDFRFTHRLMRSILRSVSVALISLILTTVLLSACSSAFRSITGTVVDVGDYEAPLPGVAVVAIRESDAGMIADTGTACDDVQLTYTDAQGRFHFPPLSPASLSFWGNAFLGTPWVFVTVYKRGYHSTQGADAHFVNSASMRIAGGDDAVVGLRKHEGSFEAEVQYMRGIALDFFCPGLPAADTALMPLLRQIDADATVLATTPEQLQIVKSDLDVHLGITDKQKFIHDLLSHH